MKREKNLDFTAGVLIIYMIYGHCAQIAGTEDIFPYKELQYFLYFFMGWFFFKSGMFHKTNKKMSTMVRDDIQRLIKPFAICSFMGLTVNIAFLVINRDINWIHYVFTPFKEIILGGSLSGNLPLWFLPTLFFVRPIFVIICKIKNRKLMKTLIVLSGIIAFKMSCIESIFFHNWITAIFTGIFFYGCGFLLKKLQYNNYVIWISLILYSSSFFYNSMVDFRTNTLISGHYLCWLISSLSGIIVWNNISKYIRKDDFFVQIGINSMFYYALHWLPLYLISNIMIVMKLFMNPVINFVILAISTLIFFVILQMYISKNTMHKLGLK